MKWKIILGVVFTLVIFGGLTLPMVPVPQNWYEMPIVPGLEEKARIIFFHIPTAWVAVFAFISALFYGIKYLRNKTIEYDIKSVAAAGLGFIFCILATVTGAIWAKFSWGAFWSWDPRQTSIFMLFLIYGAYFALRSSIEIEEKRASLSAVYSIIAGVTAPFFIFIMPRIVPSLHPDPIINQNVSFNMAPIMLIVLLASLTCFLFIYYWMFKIKVSVTLLKHYQQSHS